MQINKQGVVAALMMTALVLSPLAEAKRMGGGKSYGMSRNNSSASRSNSRPTPPPQQQNAPQRSGPGVGGMVAAGVAGAAIGAVAANAMADDPTTNTDPTTATENGAASTAQPEEKKGFGWLWIIVSAMAAFFIFRRFSAKRAAANNASNPFAPNTNSSNRQPFNPSANAGPFTRGNNAAPTSNSNNGSNTNIFGQNVGATSGTGGAFSSNGNQLADGTEPAAFLRQARAKFLHLQSMNSSSNVEEVRRYFTPDMYTAIREDILSNDDFAEFPQLSAQVLESSQENGQYVASVEFSGTVSESVNAQAIPFTEVWHFVKLQNSSEWLVAGIQQN